MAKYDLPALTDREWARIKVHISRPKAGPPPRHDRAIVSAVCYAQASGCSYEKLPPGYPKAMSIRTRAQRWQRAGVLPAILGAAAPAIKRMGADYWSRLSELSPWGHEWKLHREKDDPAYINLPRR
jgi:transposase